MKVPLRVYRTNRTRASNAVHRWYHLMLTDAHKPEWDLVQGELRLPSWWPWYSEVLIKLVRTAVKEAEACARAEAEAEAEKEQEDGTVHD